MNIIEQLNKLYKEKKENNFITFEMNVMLDCKIKADICILISLN